MPENIDTQLLLNDYAIPWGIKIALALVIFYFGRIVVGVVVKVVARIMNRGEMDEMLVRFLSSILRWVLLLFVVIAALSQSGIDTTSLIALLGAAGLAIGLSLQSSLYLYRNTHNNLHSAFDLLRADHLTTSAHSAAYRYSRGKAHFFTAVVYPHGDVFYPE